MVIVEIKVDDFLNFQELCRDFDRQNGRRNDSPGNLAGRFVVPFNSGQLREMHNQMMRELPAYLARRLNYSNRVYLVAAIIFIIGSILVGVAVSEENPYIGVAASAALFGGMVLAFREHYMGRRDSRYQDRLLNSFNMVIVYASLTPDRSDTIQNWYSQFTVAATTNNLLTSQAT